MTATEEAAESYLDRRLRFTTAVAQQLTRGDKAHDALVYGVWLAGQSSPVYVGQTSEGRRRLWDLPIGESHHLANSFPPEIWSRVIVVYWREVYDALHDDICAEMATSEDAANDSNRKRFGDDIGLGLEHVLQRELQPLMNRRKKRRDGTWRTVAWNKSSSVGARIAPRLAPLVRAVKQVWDQLATCAPDVDGVEITGGRAIFPTAIYERYATGSR